MQDVGGSVKTGRTSEVGGLDDGVVIAAVAALRAVAGVALAAVVAVVAVVAGAAVRESVGVVMELVMGPVIGLVMVLMATTVRPTGCLRHRAPPHR
jgi:hypothetical protein